MTRETFFKAKKLVDDIESLKAELETVKTVGVKVSAQGDDLSRFVDIPAIQVDAESDIQSKINTKKAKFTAL